MIVVSRYDASSLVFHAKLKKFLEVEAMVKRPSEHPNMALDSGDMFPRFSVWLRYFQCGFKLELKHSDVSLYSFGMFDIFFSMSLRECPHIGAILDVCLVRKVFLVHA